MRPLQVSTINIVTQLQSFEMKLNGRDLVLFPLDANKTNDS